MTAAWRRYLLAGTAASVVYVLLPLGVGRGIVYCLIGASSAVALVAGARWHRPACPEAWYIIAAGTAVRVAGDGLYSWYEDVVGIDPFPSLADAFYLSGYLLFAAGLLLLVQSRGPAHRPIALLDGAIFTIRLALASWVFLIEPTWGARWLPRPFRSWSGASRRGCRLSWRRSGSAEPRQPADLRTARQLSPTVSSPPARRVLSQRSSSAAGTGLEMK